MRKTKSTLLLAALALSACSEEPTNPRLDAAVSALITQNRLDVGEALAFTGIQTRNIPLKGGSTGAEYLLVPFNSAPGMDPTVAVEIDGEGFTPANTSVNRSPAGAPLFDMAGTALMPDEDFHIQLRETERRELGPLLRTGASRSISAARTSSALEVPSVGDILTLNGSLNACTGYNARFGRVEAIGERSIIVSDTLNPSGGFTPAEYQQVADAFDDLVYPVATENFGETVDIDNNGRAIIFYTRVVNELTGPNSDEVVGGFFYSRDLFPPAECATSNVAELFYLLAPDPNGEINGNVRSKQGVFNSTIGVTIHEFQHLINASRRIYVNDASDFEQTWLNEGLSHISEELLFYSVSGLTPRQNIDIDLLRSRPSYIQAVNAYQLDNLYRYLIYLEDPAEESLLGVDNLPTRGASWAYLRYVADHEEGPDQPLWYALVNSVNTGVTNLQGVLTENPIDLMQTWTASVYTDDYVDTESYLYQQPSWNFRSLLPVINDDLFPLEVDYLGTSGAEYTLQGGGAAFVRFAIEPSASGVLNITSGGAVAPERLRATIVRVR